MGSSVKFLSTVAVCIVTAFLLPGCGVNDLPVSSPLTGEEHLRIAVLPVTNYSGSPAPLKEIQQSFIDILGNAGVAVVDEAALDAVITQHRMRYLGGIDENTARAFRNDTGCGAVLITCLELYHNGIPPRIAMTVRLVSTEGTPSILWIKGVGLCGDQAPGLLDLSLITDPQTLLEKALLEISNSLMEHLVEKKRRSMARDPKGKFDPKISYTSPVFDPEIDYRVAVAPFYNLSERRFAGEIMELHFIRCLMARENFQVVEPGLTRETFLELRIIMDDGLSLANSDVILSRLDTDLVLAGKILDYQDGETGIPKIDFSALLLERKSREVIWLCDSHNQGDDGVFFFDQGKEYTAHSMASAMVQAAVNTIGK